MLNLNNVYSYYGTQAIWPKGYNKSQSHDKNDLKTVYKNMVKQNQKLPFYKFSFPDTTQAFAIGIKEAAMGLEFQSSSLSNYGTGTLEELTAVSDDESVVFASLNNQNGSEDLPDSLSIKVESLATGQTNVGNFLPAEETSFSPGDYSFGISVGRNQYTFNITVQEGNTNQQIQRNLVRSINEHSIGVRASLRNNAANGTSALVLRSNSVGQPNHDDLYFRFDEVFLSNDIAKPLGIENVDTAPSNAEFYINDVRHTSISNRISLNHAVDLDLLSTSETPININLVPDEEKISDRLDEFVYSYNQLVDISRKGSSQKGATRLFHDVTRIARQHQEELSSAGLKVNDSGYLNRTKTTDSAEVHKLFHDDSTFRRDIKQITQKMTLNPLNYIDKTVVTYPNTTGTYPNPYQPSKYSGLLFNDYA